MDNCHPCIMSVQYTGECAIQQDAQYTGDIMSTLGGIMINVGEGHWENNRICMETPVY